MATTTTNLGLTKPAVSDAADISVLNANFDKIDAKIPAAGAAPAGYGLGSVYGKWCSDCNAATENGFYSLAGSGLVNGPGWYIGYGTMFVVNRSGGSHITQIATFKNISTIRSYADGEWLPWEWDNPPMQPGEEYRTTERWHGKVVYAKTVDFGNLPAPGEQKVITGFAPGIRYAVRVVPCYWFVSQLKNYQGLMNEVDKYYFSEGSSSESGRFTIKGASGLTYDPANWTCQIQAFYTKD